MFHVLVPLLVVGVVGVVVVVAVMVVVTAVMLLLLLRHKLMFCGRIKILSRSNSLQQCYNHTCLFNTTDSSKRKGLWGVSITVNYIILESPFSSGMTHLL